MIKDIEWLSYFISMLFEEFEDDVILAKTLEFGRNFIADKALY